MFRKNNTESRKSDRFYEKKLCIQYARHIIAYILILTMLCPYDMVCALDFESLPKAGCFSYQVVENEVTIVRCNEKYEDQVIPSTIEGKDVTTIATGALVDFLGSELTIPKTVKVICEGAFEDANRDDLQITYLGTMEEWKAVKKGEKNSALSSAIMNYSDSKVDFSKTKKMDALNNSVLTGYSTVQRYLIKKDRTLWENPNDGTYGKVKKPQKIASKVKEACQMATNGGRGAFVLKTNGTLWLYFKNVGKNQNYKGKKIMTGVKELPQITIGFYYRNEAFYVVRKNGELWSVKLKCTSYGRIKGWTQKKVASGVCHVYRTIYTKLSNLSSTEFLNIYFLKKDGSLWGWGHNVNGELGNGNKKKQKKPVKILNDVQKFSCCNASGGANSRPRGITAFAIKKDGTLWAWGANVSQTIHPIGLNLRSLQSTGSKRSHIASRKKLGNKITKPVEVMRGVTDVSTDAASDARGNIIFTFSIIRNDHTLWTKGAGGELTKVDDDVLCINMDGVCLYYVKMNHELWYYRDAGCSIRVSDGTVTLKSEQKKIMDNVYYVRDGYAIKGNGSLWSWKIRRLKVILKSRKKIMDGFKIPH